MKSNLKRTTATVVTLLGINLLAGCSSTPPVRTQAYAKLNHQRTYEVEFPIVWKALEETLRNFKITHRDPSDVDALELKKLTHRTLETDWIYGQSRDKYQEYSVNGFPRKVLLQTRFKYFVDCQSVMGGILVTVKTEEEIERLKSDGTSAGYSSVDQADSSRSHELLDKIHFSILAAPNTSQPGAT